LFDKPKQAVFTEFLNMVEEMENSEKGKSETKTAQFFSFNPNTIPESELDSLGLPKNIRSNIIKYRNKGGKFRDKESFRKIYGMNDSIFSLIEPYLIFEQTEPKAAIETEIKSIASVTEMFFFDPNTATGSDFINLGLSQPQASNIIHYREKGGRYRNSNDLAKIYAIDSVTFTRLAPWIVIHDSVVAEKVQEPRSIKTEIIVELNSADSASLVGLPGIGPATASRIIKFRQALGGFYEINQLLEVYGLKQETLALIQGKITIDTSLISKVSLNFSDYEELTKHPYITGADAKNIIKQRNKFGPYESCEELGSKKIIESITFRKLRPYLKLN
jgi:DNA uptake protein ComE-like DNA-binding protein